MTKYSSFAYWQFVTSFDVYVDVASFVNNTAFGFFETVFGSSVNRGKF